MDRKEIAEGDIVHAFQPADVSTDNDVLTRMPKTCLNRSKNPLTLSGR
jgi:hypothetical protein